MPPSMEADVVAGGGEQPRRVVVVVPPIADEESSTMATPPPHCWRCWWPLMILNFDIDDSNFEYGGPVTVTVGNTTPPPPKSLPSIYYKDQTIEWMVSISERMYQCNT